MGMAVPAVGAGAAITVVIERASATEWLHYGMSRVSFSTAVCSVPGFISAFSSFTVLGKCASCALSLHLAGVLFPVPSSYDWGSLKSPEKHMIGKSVSVLYHHPYGDTPIGTHGQVETQYQLPFNLLHCHRLQRTVDT